MQTIRIKAPATIANLVCGFDVLGLCLHEPFDIMEVRLLSERKVIVRTTNGFPLPERPEENTAGAPLLGMLEKIEENIGFEVIITKQIKPGSGIGSSAASAAGAVVAANLLLQKRFTNEDLVRFAMLGEKVASGVKHADNIAPCIYGGVTLIKSIFPLDIIPLDFPECFITVVHPQIEVRTADARQILKKEVQLKDAIRQWGNIAGMVAGFLKKDLALIGRSMEDIIIEPSRSILIPGFHRIRSGSVEAGALGGGISGSGPSLFMISAEKETAQKVALFMSSVYQELGIDHHTYITTINGAGIIQMP